MDAGCPTVVGDPQADVDGAGLGEGMVQGLCGAGVRLEGAVAVEVPLVPGDGPAGIRVAAGARLEGVLVADDGRRGRHVVGDRGRVRRGAHGDGDLGVAEAILGVGHPDAARFTPGIE